MKKNLAVAAALALSLVSLSSFAGRRSFNQVVVDTTRSKAYGALGDARASADVTQEIGCNLYSTPSTTRMTCWARDAQDQFAMCTSTSAQLIKAAQSVGTDTYLTFGWDATGACTELRVYNVSTHTPKVN